MKKIICGYLLLSVFGLLGAEAKPNVLFIISDDLTAESLACYGNKQCKTPNIDRLAKQGVRFTRAYCQYGVCGASRASMMSGMFPQAIDVITNPDATTDRFTKNLGDRSSMAQIFKRNAYYTARVSKIYHMRVPGDITAGVHGPDHAASWTERFSVKAPEQWSIGEHEHISNEKLKFERDKHYSLGFGWAYYSVKTSTDGTEQADELACNKAIEVLKQHGDKPFFLAVGFVRPHVPLVAPASYFESYPFEKMETHKVDPNKDRGSKKKGITAIDKKQKVLAAYYAATSYMDAQVGRLLEALDASGVRDNTVVVFTSDHGYSLGNQGRWSKGGLAEEVARVPLIVDAPGISPAVSGSLVQLVDLFPTFADLAGFEIPEHVQGKSFAAVLKNPGQDVHEFAYTLAGKRGDSQSHLIRTKRWAFTAKSNGENPGLYDMEVDPKRLKNLAGDPEYKGTVEKMRGLLREHLEEIGTTKGTKN